jgi:RNA polymerase sigma factor (TIGR02999 family)
MDAKGEITDLLRRLSRGEREAINQLLPMVYDELHRIARSYFRRERGDHTLQPTALVHEAYLRLIGQHAELESRSHFLALAATQMRRILVDYARKHAAGRRGGGGEKVLLDSGIAAAGNQPLDIIALDSALAKLGDLDPTLARMVELRFFGGLSVEDTAGIMGISTATVKRSWSSARAFLHREIVGTESATSAP